MAENYGICCICGGELQEEGQCMHVRELSLSPGLFEQPTIYRGLWICFDCNDQLARNVTRNARTFNRAVEE